MLNSVSLVGRMTKDVVMFQVGDNVKGSFTLAVNRDYKDKDGNTPCDFIECEVWNAGASFLDEYAGFTVFDTVIFDDRNGIVAADKTKIFI